MQIGLSADEVLHSLGWNKAAAVRPPEVVGKDDSGLIVRWHYWDAILTLRRRDGRYCVVEVKERGFWSKLWWRLIRGK